MKLNQMHNSHALFIAALSGFVMLILSSCGTSDGTRTIPETPFTRDMGNRHHRISKEQAINMLRAYDLNRDSLIRGRYASDTLMMPISETFKLSAVDSLLTQSGISALRAYIAMDPVTKRLKLIMVGVDKDGKDILQSSRGGRMAFGGGTDSLDYILEEGNRFP